MLLDDLFEYIGGAGVVPNTFGVNHCDRSLCADTQAICLSAEYLADGLEVQFAESFFEIVPRDDAFGTLAAFVFTLIAAEEDVFLDVIGDTEMVCC